MPKIVGGSSSIPPGAINSADSVQNAEEPKAPKSVETASNTPTESKTPVNTRALTEHKMMGNLQQMKLNSMFDAIPLKGGIEPKQAWEFENGYPVKWQGADFDASKNEVAIEKLEIAHQGFLRETSTSQPGKIEYPNLSFYIPEPEDTLQSIASKFGVTAEALAKANNLKPEDPLPPRIQLKIIDQK